MVFPSFLDFSQSWGSGTSEEEYMSKQQGRGSSKHKSNHTTSCLTDSVNKRCRMEYGWTSEFTLRVMRGYQQFLELKASMNDINKHTILPSPIINKYWRQHVLHTKAYRDDCMSALGEFLEYDPDEVDCLNAQYKKKVKSTQIALAARYGRHELDTDVWDFRPISTGPSDMAANDRNAAGGGTGPSPGRDDVPTSTTTGSGIMPNLSMRSSHRHEPSTPSSAYRLDSRHPSYISAMPVTPGVGSAHSVVTTSGGGGGGSSSSNTLVLAVRNPNGDEASFKVKPTTKFEKLMTAYGKLKTLNVDGLKFTTRNGRQIYRNDTAEQFGMRDGEVIFVTY